MIIILKHSQCYGTLLIAITIIAFLYVRNIVCATVELDIVTLISSPEMLI